MLADQNIAHIFAEKVQNISIRDHKLSWEASLLAESSTLCESSYFDGEMYCPQSIHGVCAPIVGYEVLQKRKTVTMYKINVITEEKNWFVFRTYTDFVNFDKELRKQYPGICVKLPGNSIFKNKFSPKFLDRRRRDLQIYMDVLMQHNEISNCDIMRDFLSLTDPPGPYNDLLHSKAYCEQMEANVKDLSEKINELQRELDLTKTRLVQSLTQNKIIESMCAEEVKKNTKLIMERKELLDKQLHPDIKTISDIDAILRRKAETCK